MRTMTILTGKILTPEHDSKQLNRDFVQETQSSKLRNYPNLELDRLMKKLLWQLDEKTMPDTYCVSKYFGSTLGISSTSVRHYTLFFSMAEK